MPFDSTCKYLAEHFPQDIATWLLGHPIALTKLEPTELSVEPIRADSLILLESEEAILHVEFQVDPKSDIPFRLADYRLRLYRRSPEKPVRQIVLYLRQSDSPWVYQTTFAAGGLQHEFEVLRLWECPVTQFLGRPGLLPFAVLSQVSNRAQVLQQIAPVIEAISNRQQRSDVAASTALLAGLVLERDIIRRVLRKDIMKESVIFQEIDAAGFDRGVQTGIQTGIQQGEQALILRLLQRRVGSLTSEARSHIEALPREQLESLGEALLDFSSAGDLENWLQDKT
jgi:predicted transposase/invertase (TIGR01784 family)